MSQRSNTIKAAGLYTFLSELQAPEGSQVIADNVNIDELGVITSRRGFNDYGSELPIPSDRLKQILSYKNRILRYYNTTLEYDDGNGNFSAFTGDFNEVEDGFRIKAEEVNGNLYFTSSDGIKKTSASSSSDLSSVNPIDAGAPKAIDLSVKTIPSVSGFLPPQSKVAYKVLFGYKDNNNVLILGAPTSRFVVTNNSSDIVTPEQSSITFLKNELTNIIQTTKITCADAANTTETTDSNESYIKLYTANDVTGYYIWFNKGTGADPVGTTTPEDLSTFTGIEVDISAAITDTEVSQALFDALSTIPTFNVSIVGNEVTIENDEAGATTDASTPSSVVSPEGVLQTDNSFSDIGTGWSILITNQGVESYIYFDKYFTIDSIDNSYYIWFSDETETEVEAPQDEGTLGRTGIEIKIAKGSSGSIIAQKVSNKLFSEFEELFQLVLDIDTVTFTSKEKGNLVDMTSGTLEYNDDVLNDDVTITIVQQGTVTEGSNANCEITTIIPDGVTTDYFIQVYRTNSITLPDDLGLTINDIDPGEECNLVYEEPVTQPEGTTIAITDITPDSFRDTGVPLYNNPFSGEGLLQTNDIPPIAKDIENFNNYTFYSNTKTFHRSQFTFVSVNDFGDLETSIVIGNEDDVRKYDFQGQKQVTTITCGIVDNTFETKLFNEFNGSVNGVTGNVYITADTEGPLDYPTLVGDGTSTLDDLISDWNTSNPENTITLQTANGTDIPDISEEIVLKKAGSYIELYSANDEAKYVIYFDKGTAIPPAIDDAVLVRVNLSDEGILPSENVGFYLQIALLEFNDFEVTYDNINTVTITNTNNGESTDASTPTSIPSTDIGSGWNLSIVNGRGEDSTINTALWSVLPSVGQAIEETARSFVRIVNKDVSSPVRATYLSGENDLPGLILLENKDLEDKPFYIGVKNVGTIGADIGAEFNPELPVIDEDVDSIVSAPSDSTITRITTSNPHGISTGQNIYFYAPNNDPVISNKYQVTVVDPNTFDINFTTLTGNSTDAFFFLTNQESDNEVKPNRIYYSKLQQPEAVPITNFIDIGGKDEPIERILALRDTLFVLKTDGIYTLTGFNAPFNVRLLDNTTNIIAPDSAVVLDNQIFALMDDGISVITESGSQVISRSIEDKILAVTGTDVDFRLKTFGVAYDNDKAYLLWLPSNSSDENATQCLRYNYYERTWTRWTVAATCARVSKSENTLYIGDGTRSFLQKERKNRSRLDYSDRDFSLSIPANSIDDVTINLSNYSEVDVGDVLVQDQYITIDIFNNLLVKLDNDIGISSSDYEITLKIKSGDNLADFMNNLNQKLLADGLIVTGYIWSNNPVSIKDNHNSLINELNDVNSGTAFKTYREVNEITTYESIVDEKNTIRPDLNEIKTLIDSRFFEGSVQVWKSIKKTIQWNPFSFGDPSAQKQFSKGTIVMDQNNFTKATVSYSSDVSQGFVDIEKRGKGVGYQSSGFYGELDLYWGGNGNDVPIMSIIPREKQRGRYLNVKFQHSVAREGFRILGLSTVIRAVSDRAYR